MYKINAEIKVIIIVCDDNKDSLAAPNINIKVATADKNISNELVSKE